MQYITGEDTRPPIEARLSSEFVTNLTPLLAAIARRSDALYTRALPVATDRNREGNALAPVGFAASLDEGARSTDGTVEFQLGIQSGRIHNSLLISRDQSNTLKILRDYKVVPGESHLIEISAVPMHRDDGYDYGDFAVDVWKRIWTGSPTGRAEPEPQLGRLDIARSYVKTMRPQVRAAEVLVNQEIRRQAT